MVVVDKDPDRIAVDALATAQRILALEWFALTVQWFGDSNAPPNRMRPGVPIPAYTDCKALHTIYVHESLRATPARLEWSIHHELHHVVTTLTEGCPCVDGVLDMASHERAERQANAFADAHCPAWAEVRGL